MNDFQKYLDAELSKVVFDDDTIDDDNQPDLEQTIARQIVNARSELKLSQSALAKRTKIQQSSLSKIEHGEGNPSLLTLKRIADGLGKKLIITLE